MEVLLPSPLKWQEMITQKQAWESHCGLLIQIRHLEVGRQERHEEVSFVMQLVRKGGLWGLGTQPSSPL